MPSETPQRMVKSAQSDDPAQRLWSLWRRGQRPDVDAFLAQAGPLPPAEVAAVLRADQRERWQAGEYVPAESYLERHPAVRADRDSAVDLVYNEFLLREQRAERPTPEEFARRFPDLADVLRPQIELHWAMAASGSEAQDTTPPREGGATPEGPAPPRLPGYEILGELARGGMGVVYRAWQTTLKRLVAIKVILVGAQAGADHQRRFQREAEAVASLRHPNIVQVYDHGTADGCPYLVLEFVEGGTLARKTAGNPQPPAEAARVVETLAVAMEHAHRQGLVHRDLKPANVLLTADGVLKIADFGLVKQLDDRAADTATGDLVGTPSHMAPEQVEDAFGPVGPWTDVYALGVILYELLTGRVPFHGGSVLHVLQQIKEAVPARPSWLRPGVPHDLETICLKCLDKTPARRYASAAALAEDLRRFQAGEPVTARPVGTAVRAWRWCRRKPAQAGLAAAVALAVLATVAGAVVAAVVSEQGRRAVQAESVETAKQRDRAERARDRTFEALELLTSSVTGASLQTQVALSPEQKRFLAEVLAYYWEFAAEQGEDEGARRRVTAAARRVAFIHYRLGDQEAGVRAFEQARDGYDRLAADFPAVPEHRQGLAGSHHNLGLLLAELGKRPAAEAEYRQALALYELLAADFPAVPEHRGSFASCHHNLGRLLHELGKRPAAEVAYRTALPLLEQLAAEFPAVPEYRRDLANSHHSLGRLLHDLSQRPAAEAEYRQALAVREKLAADFPAIPRYRQVWAGTHNALGLLLAELGKRPAAEAEYRRALAVQEKLAADFPAVPDYRGDLASTHTNLGDLLCKLRQWSAAEAAHRRAVALLEQVVADFPAVPKYLRHLAGSHNNLGILLDEQGQRPAAEAEYRRALALHGKLAADFPSVPVYRTDLARSQVNFGQWLGDGGQGAEAMAWFDRAITLLQPLVEAEPRLAHERRLLGTAHWGRAAELDMLDRPADAVADWDRAVNLSSAAEKAIVRAGRARSLVRAGQVEKAVAEVADLAKAPEGDATLLYALACVYALAAGKDEPNREGHIQDALHLLRRAVAKGYKDAAHMKKDDDLKPLRDRADFQKLLAAVEAKTASNPP